MSGLALASPRLLDHDDDQENRDKNAHKRRNGDDENMLDNDHHEGTLQEFAEHFMVQVWREGMQVWEDYRDDQVSPFADSAQTEYCTTFHCSSVRSSQA